MSVVDHHLPPVHAYAELHVRRTGGDQREDALVGGRGVLVEFEGDEERELFREKVAFRHEGRGGEVKGAGARSEAVGMQTVGVVVGDLDPGGQSGAIADGVAQQVDRLQVCKTTTDKE